MKATCATIGNDVNFLEPCPLKKYDKENPHDHLCNGNCMWMIGVKGPAGGYSTCAVSIIAMHMIGD